MIQVLPASPKKSFLQSVLGGIAENVPGAIEKYQQARQSQRSNQTLKDQLGVDISTLPPELQKVFATQILKNQAEQQKNSKRQDLWSQINNGNEANLGDKLRMGEPETANRESLMEEPPETPKSSKSPKSLKKALELPYSESQVIEAEAAGEHNLAEHMRKQNQIIQNQQIEEKKGIEKKFESERNYHTQFTKESNKEVESIRNSLPKLEMALTHARDSVESGDLSFFSPDKLADATGLDLFRTAKGAQLITAGKENLLGNMSRVSARGQNIWFEQRLNSMFPKIGQSKEANLTVQEMLEGEAAMSKAYINEYDRLAEEDEKEYGFERKDLNKRARKAAEFKDKEIMKRTTYRMKEIEEQEKGLTSLKNQAGKNVSKGTPLTLANAKIYKEKFGDKALEVAKKNGYYIPSLEEFSTFRESPQEHREKL